MTFASTCISVSISMSFSWLIKGRGLSCYCHNCHLSFKKKEKDGKNAPRKWSVVVMMSVREILCCVIVGDVINVLGTIFSQFFFCIFSFPSSYLSSMVHLPQELPITPLPFLPHLFSHLHSFPSNVRKNTVKVHLKRDCWNDRYCHVCSMKHTFLLEKSILIKSVFND